MSSPRSPGRPPDDLGPASGMPPACPRGPTARRWGAWGRRRRGVRAGSRARRAGRGGAMAAERDRQRDRHPGGGEHSRRSRGARPEAHLLHASVDRALQPAQPRLTPSDIARYMGIGRFGTPAAQAPSVEHGVPAVISRDRPDLDGAVPGRRVLRRHLDGLVEIGAVDHVVPGDLLLGLGERPVADQQFRCCGPAPWWRR